MRRRRYGYVVLIPRRSLLTPGRTWFILADWALRGADRWLARRERRTP